MDLVTAGTFALSAWSAWKALITPVKPAPAPTPARPGAPPIPVLEPPPIPLASADFVRRALGGQLASLSPAEILAFQVYWGLPQTGVFDTATAQLARTLWPSAAPELLCGTRTSPQPCSPEEWRTHYTPAPAGPPPPAPGHDMRPTPFGALGLPGGDGVFVPFEPLPVEPTPMRRPGLRERLADRWRTLTTPTPTPSAASPGLTSSLRDQLGLGDTFVRPGGGPAPASGPAPIMQRAWDPLVAAVPFGSPAPPASTGTPEAPVLVAQQVFGQVFAPEVQTERQAQIYALEAEIRGLEHQRLIALQTADDPQQGAYARERAQAHADRLTIRIAELLLTLSALRGDRAPSSEADDIRNLPAGDPRRMSTPRG